MKQSKFGTRLFVPAAGTIMALLLVGCGSSASVATSAASTPDAIAASESSAPAEVATTPATSEDALTGEVTVQTTGADAGYIWDGDIQAAAIAVLKTAFPTIDTQPNFGLDCPTMKADVGATQSCPLTSGATDQDVFDTTISITAVDGDSATFEIVVADPAALEQAQR